MGMNRGRGKLYRIGSEQFVTAINYQVHEALTTDPPRWWGELTLNENVDIRSSDRYIIKLEDGRKGKCYLKKLVNRVARGVPPRYFYHFTGLDLLE
jgi:hypothetical protein